MIAPHELQQVFAEEERVTTARSEDRATPTPRLDDRSRFELLFAMVKQASHRGVVVVDFEAAEKLLSALRAAELRFALAATSSRIRCR